MVKARVSNLVQLNNMRGDRMSNDQAMEKRPRLMVTRLEPTSTRSRILGPSLVCYRKQYSPTLPTFLGLSRHLLLLLEWLQIFTRIRQEAVSGNGQELV
jgi:hypothetical protein